MKSVVIDSHHFCSYNYRYRSMQFEWSKEKNIQNTWKHGINFDDVAPLFFEPAVYSDVSRPEDLEKRSRLLGLLKDRVLSVVFTRRSNNIRLISARPANTEERIFFALSERKFFWDIHHE